MKNVITSLSSAVTAPLSAANAHSKQIRNVAKQFEATFMSEMIKLARPTEHGDGALDNSRSEDTWRYFMDEALGKAMVDSANQDSGLSRLVERDLKTADSKSSQQEVKS